MFFWLPIGLVVGGFIGAVFFPTTIAVQNFWRRRFHMKEIGPKH